MSDCVTQGIHVHVEAEYLPHESSPKDGLWVHMYHVTLENRSPRTVQLMSRHWVITDAEGKVEHVNGPGVVGQQPVLRPGETFRYTSGCPLRTSFGTMHGTYQLVAEGGDPFDAEIAPFTLAEPYANN